MASLYNVLSVMYPDYITSFEEKKLVTQYKVSGMDHSEIVRRMNVHSEAELERHRKRAASPTATSMAASERGEVGAEKRERVG